jgi:hypothetical protein
MLAHMLGQHAGVEIIDVAGGKPNDDPDSFALVKRSLSLKVGNTKKQK